MAIAHVQPGYDCIIFKHLIVLKHISRELYSPSIWKSTTLFDAFGLEIPVHGNLA